MSYAIKICGVKSREALAAAASAGATHVGFAFFAKSPRAVSHDQARMLADAAPDTLARVALLVDPADEDVANAVLAARPALIQLHGKETPARAADIRARFKTPVMKALPIAAAADVARARDYEETCDWLLFDAKPDPNADRPGGHGRAFDWSLLKGYAGRKPWMLSGGLNPENVGEAVRISGAHAVDVSSGVESRPGQKSTRLIEAFAAAAKAALQEGAPA